MTVQPDIFESVDKIGQKGLGIELFGIGEPENVGLFSSQDVVIYVDGVVQVVVDEVVTLSVDDLVVLVGFLLAEHHVLQGSQGLSDLLHVIALFVLFSSVFALIGEGVVLAALLDLVLGPFLVLFEEDLLDIRELYLQSEWEFG